MKSDNLGHDFELAYSIEFKYSNVVVPLLRRRRLFEVLWQNRGPTSESKALVHIAERVFQWQKSTKNILTRRRNHHGHIIHGRIHTLLGKSYRNLKFVPAFTFSSFPLNFPNLFMFNTPICLMLNTCFLCVDCVTVSQFWQPVLILCHNFTLVLPTYWKHSPCFQCLVSEASRAKSMQNR